jgi:hypothetical protein
MADQVVTVTETTHRPIDLVVWDWLCTDGGIVSSATTSYYTGRILYAIQIPDGGGTLPTDAYDVTVLDSNGVDVLNGLGANLNHDVVTYKADVDGLGAVCESKLTLTIAAAGNAKGGQTILYIQ